MKKAFRIVSLIVSLVLFIGALFITANSISVFSERYHSLRDADLQDGYSGSYYYDDGMYAMLGYGIEIDPMDPQKDVTMDQFLSSTLYEIEGRILAAGLVYTLMTSAVLAYYLSDSFGEDPKRHTLSVIISSLILFLVFAGTVIVSLTVNKVPVYLPKGKSLLAFLASILSIIGGGCALGFLLRSVKYKLITALIFIPLVFGLFLFGSIFEVGLYSDACVGSFDYVYDYVEEGREEEIIYDEEKDVMVYDGKEYEKELVPNDEHLFGVKYAGAALFEVVWPHAGSSLELVRQSIGASISVWAYLLYILKSLFWIIVPSLKR